MSVSELVYEARELAAELQTDSCVIRRKSGQSFDEESGAYVDTYADIWAGACRVKPRDVVTGSTANAGERVISLHHYVVSLLIEVTWVAVDDVVEILASETDPGLVGAKMLVRDVTKGSQISARRLTCEEVLT